ncbi:DUF7144 family membrane protein [Actinoplanes flavus]|uniref:DUF7144 domain-containing protein n=1 Tax=Actinoplanes flavus TaxID=2820290 RepID=A0ABS3UKB4_9ACTN|nr:hypothetical protein [Actinoplanes flavus]MBO3739227.1 hypothetical protein [Actinoplanes flavus]
MTIDHRGDPVRRVAPTRESPAPEADTWIGLLVFGGVMLLALGVFQLMEGFTALLHGEAYLVTAEGMLIEPNPQAWGWTHLLLGLVSGAAGVGILFGQTWARVVGVLFTAAGALVHFLFLATAPVWCTILIALEVLVIYALCAHGGDIRRGHHS